MKLQNKLPTKHDDLVHDVRYDFYGERIATCSSDRTIKVWDHQKDGSWAITSEWEAHNAPVWKLDWAHPEFGQILASCSQDRTVHIWEEETRVTDGKATKSWIRKASLAEATEGVLSVKFAPKQRGLQLATCSANTVRIYKVTDMVTLNSWEIVEQFSTSSPCTCISWNPSPADAPSMVVGTHTAVSVWGFKGEWKLLYTLVGNKQQVHDVAWAPNMGRTYHIIASAGKDNFVRLWKLPTGIPEKEAEIKPLHEFGEHKSEVWRVEWNVTGTVLASSGDDGKVRLWKADWKEWKMLSVIKGGSNKPVASLA